MDRGNSQTLPLLQPAGRPCDAATATSTLLSPVTHSVKVGAACVSQLSTDAAPRQCSVPAASAKADNSRAAAASTHDMAAAVVQRGEEEGRTRSAATTPHHTTAVLRAKLQRALWLDQLTSCNHAESGVRAGLRCSEAEARENLWWLYQQAKTAIDLREEYTRRAAALAAAQATQQQRVEQAPFEDLVERAEPEARRAIQLDAFHFFQLLRITENTQHMEFVARQVAAERQAAADLEKTAMEVRALELDLATRSYHPSPAFNPSLSDLFLIADGLPPPASGVPQEMPLRKWRRTLSHSPQGHTADFNGDA